MPDGEDVARADEDVRLAERDAPITVVRELRRPQHDEERIAVLLELRPLVGTERVLDREVVQAERLLEASQELFVGLLDADPHELIRLAEDVADLGDRDVPDLVPAGVGGGVDDTSHGLRQCTRGRIDAIGHGPVRVAGPRVCMLATSDPWLQIVGPRTMQRRDGNSVALR